MSNNKPTNNNELVWAISGKTEHLATVLEEKGEKTLIKWSSNGETALVPTSGIIPNSEMGRRGRGGRRASRRGATSANASAAASTSPATATATTPKKRKAPPPSKTKPKPKKTIGKSAGENIHGDVKTPASITSMEVEVEAKEEDQVQPDTVPSSISTSSAASTAAPDPVSSSAAAAAATVSATKPKAAQPPVAFVEKDFVVNQDSKEEGEEEQGGKEARGTVPETITSSDNTSTTGTRAQQHSTTGGVIIKHEQAWAGDKDTNNNNRKRRKQGSKVPIKSEELGNIHDAGSIKRPRMGRKRNQCPSEEKSAATSDNVNANRMKNRRVAGRAGGGGGRNAPNNIAPKRRSLRNKHPREEDNTEEEINNCCQFCNDSDWECRILYKCGAVLKKYFPKSNNNPNPGWYKGTIRAHHIISSSDYSSDSEYEDEADCSIEEQDKQQCIIFNEIHYEDGDMENITQDDLKLQLMDGGRVKMLQPAEMATTTNSERRNAVDVAHTPTSSDNKFDQKWLEKYNRLKQFQAENGHCRVPYRYGPDPSLGNWVIVQRYTYKQRKLAEDRVEKLDKIGFEWAIVTETPDQAWQEKYDRLKTYKEENGHCRVPNKYNQDLSLGRWVDTQRNIFKTGNLAEDRAEKLNKIGFDWGPFDQTWHEMFGRLEEFKTNNGHCRVPQNYGPDPPLGFWVKTQRAFYKRGKLAIDRAMKLEEMDFEWNPPNYRSTKRETQPRKAKSSFITR